LPNPHFGSKITIPKKFQNPFYKSFMVPPCNKTKYSKIETILKIGHHAKALQNPHFGSKIIIPKYMSNPVYKSFRVVLGKKNRKDTKYSRNETILKIGHHAKAIAFAKS